MPEPPPEPTVQRLRTALKFTLWTWAIYWPGGGLLLMIGGLDPVSIAVTLGSLVVFVVLMAGGALRSDRNLGLRQLLLERPLYLVLALALFMGVAASLPVVEELGLALFATCYLGGLGLAGHRMLQHVRASGRTAWALRADQGLLLFGMTAFFAFMVFYDALVPMLGGSTLGSPAALVAVGSWVNLAYPVLMVIAIRQPLRERLSWKRYAEPLADAFAHPHAVDAAPHPVEARLEPAPVAARRLKRPGAK